MKKAKGIDRRDFFSLFIALFGAAWPNFGTDQKPPTAQVMNVTTQNPVFRAACCDFKTIVTHSRDLAFFKKAVPGVLKTYRTIHLYVGLAVAGGA